MQGRCETLLEDLSVKEAQWSEKEERLKMEVRFLLKIYLSVSLPSTTLTQTHTHSPHTHSHTHRFVSNGENGTMNGSQKRRRKWRSYNRSTPCCVFTVTQVHSVTALLCIATGL